MEFLGVVLEDGTVQMDPAKLKGIADWLQPQQVTDVHAFLRIHSILLLLHA